MLQRLVVLTLVFSVACVNSRFSRGRYGPVTDMTRFSKEACGPYHVASPHEVSPDDKPVHDALFSRYERIQNCYASLFNRSLDLPQGCVAIHFTIDDTRRVRSSKSIWNTTGFEPVANCALKEVRSLGVVHNARPREYVQVFVFATGS